MSQNLDWLRKRIRDIRLSASNSPARTPGNLVHPFKCDPGHHFVKHSESLQSLDSILGDYVNAINSEFGDKIQLAADFSRALGRWCTDVDIEGLDVAISVFARAAEAASSNDPSRAFYAYCQEN